MTTNRGVDISEEHRLINNNKTHAFAVTSVIVLFAKVNISKRS